MLEGYERVLKKLLDLEEQAAKGTGHGLGDALVTTHANFVRETSRHTSECAKGQLKS